MLQDADGDAKERQMKTFAWAGCALLLALAGCESIHNPNIVAAERLPDGPRSWTWASGPEPAEKPNCASESYSSSHPVECPPPRTDYHCDDPTVRRVMALKCGPDYQSTRDPEKDKRN